MIDKTKLAVVMSGISGRINTFRQTGSMTIVRVLEDILAELQEVLDD